MPRSHSQTSPRRGVILAWLFCIHHAENCIGSASRFFVIERPQIERDRAAEKLCCKGPLFFDRQSVECLKAIGLFGGS